MLDDLEAVDDIKGLLAQIFQKLEIGGQNLKTRFRTGGAGDTYPRLCHIDSRHLKSPFDEFRSDRTVSATHVEHPRTGAQAGTELQQVRQNITMAASEPRLTYLLDSRNGVDVDMEILNGSM